MHPVDEREAFFQEFKKGESVVCVFDGGFYGVFPVYGRVEKFEMPNFIVRQENGELFYAPVSQIKEIRIQRTNDSKILSPDELKQVIQDYHTNPDFAFSSVVKTLEQAWKQYESVYDDRALAIDKLREYQNCEKILMNCAEFYGYHLDWYDHGKRALETINKVQSLK